MEGYYGRNLQKMAVEKLKGNDRGGRKGAIAPKLLEIDASVSGVRGRAPAGKQISCILAFTEHFWLIDILIFYNSVIQ